MESSSPTVSSFQVSRRSIATANIWISTTSSEPTFSFIAVARVGTSLGHDKVFFGGCYVSVFPRVPVKLIGELTGQYCSSPS